MEAAEIFIPQEEQKKQSLSGWLYRKFVTEKLRNVPGMILFLFGSIFIAVGIAKFGILFAAGLMIVAVGIPGLVAFVAYPLFGIIVTLCLGYFLFGIGRLGVDFPLGTVMDVLELLLILGFYIKIKPTKDWSRLKGPISFMMLVWISYNILEVLNPSASSQLAWLYTIRSAAIITLTYFVFLYQINSIRAVRLIIKAWLILSFLAALYAFKQQFIGFSSGELLWMSDPGVESLLLIGGIWRLYSFFSDPVAFSYNMVVSSIICIALLGGPIKIKKKLVLLVFLVCYIFAMVLSGTRGAFVLIPAALGFLTILKFNWKVMTFMVGATLVLVGLIFVPTSNPGLYRFQSAFKPNEDLSYQVRAVNQKRIQPYILSHPFGGGLGATGGWGQRFAPDSYLASFPPDSGYVRVAVELGWGGLLIFCILMFTILYTGIRNYYRIRDPELKTYALGMVLVVFAFNIGNFPQEALVQFPNSIYFYLVVAMISVLYRLDQQKNKAIQL